MILKRLKNRETLERIKRWPGLKRRFPKVRIYSAEWCAYWRGAGNGYTQNPAESDVLDIEDAFQTTRHCGPEKQIQFIPEQDPDTMTVSLLAVQQNVEFRLKQIAENFKDGAKMTLIVRFTDNDDADFMMTIDSSEQIRAVLDRRMGIDQTIQALQRRVEVQEAQLRLYITGECACSSGDSGRRHFPGCPVVAKLKIEELESQLEEMPDISKLQRWEPESAPAPMDFNMKPCGDGDFVLFDQVKALLSTTKEPQS